MRPLKNVRRRLAAAKKLRGLRLDHVYIKKGTYIHPGTTIGRYTRINHVSHIGLCKIGAFCAVGGRLIVRSADHHACYLNMQDWAQRYVIGSAVPVTGKYKGDVEIGNAVWIGDSVIILPGVKVGDGAIIGAGSVVTKSVPAFSVAVGNPARVVKTRFPQEIVDVLSGVKWWHWDERLLRARRKLFEIDLSAVSAAELTDILVGLGVK